MRGESSGSQPPHHQRSAGKATDLGKLHSPRWQSDPEQTSDLVPTSSPKPSYRQSLLEARGGEDVDDDGRSDSDARSGGGHSRAVDPHGGGAQIPVDEDPV
jgi:hypothetical protein